MPGTFLTSFDWEGKWGHADHLTSHHKAHFTNLKLNSVIQRILKILNKKKIKASFAFVGTYAMSVDEFYANPEWFADVTVNDRSWMFKFLEDARSKNFDGWLNPRALEMVLEQKVHEIILIAHFVYVLAMYSLIYKDEINKIQTEIEMGK